MKLSINVPFDAVTAQFRDWEFIYWRRYAAVIMIGILSMAMLNDIPWEWTMAPFLFIFGILAFGGCFILAGVIIMLAIAAVMLTMMATVCWE